MTATALVKANESNWMPVLKWCPTSISELEASEHNVLSYLKKPYTATYVVIPSVNNNENCRIRTLIMNENETDQIPLVLIHGFVSGIGFWVQNLDSLAENRPVYALDLPGYGLSTRLQFSYKADEIEHQFVETIERWRQSVGLKKFILLGHSMGGFIAAAYTLKYPNQISHLILADSWGFPEYNPNLTVYPPIWPKEPPLWGKILLRIFSFLYPLAGLRIAGPFGPSLVQKFRSDIIQKFKCVIKRPEHFASYIYHCNVQSPTGEGAFKYLSIRYGWAKFPMIHRIGDIRHDIPITLIYGSESWIDSHMGTRIKEIRENSFVQIKIIQGAGHYIFADQATEFNAFVNNVIDQNAMCENVSVS